MKLKKMFISVAFMSFYALFSPALAFDGYNYEANQQVYYVKEGTFDITGFVFEKGFQIIGAPGKNVTLNIVSPFLPGTTAGKVMFTNIALTGTAHFIENQKNDGMNYSWEGLEMVGCNLSGFPKGFMKMFTSEGNLKEIQSIYIDNCIFKNMQGGSLFETNDYRDKNVDKKLQVNQMIITNSSFINSPNFRFVFIADGYGQCGSTINFTIHCRSIG